LHQLGKYRTRFPHRSHAGASGLGIEEVPRKLDEEDETRRKCAAFQRIQSVQPILAAPYLNMLPSYKRMSERAKHLLSSGETKFVDYKVNVKGLHADDFVAFANSSMGGAILIGVRERTTRDGKQIGEPVGHPVDDESRLQIMNKALSCIPPVQIEIVVENLGSKAFYRIEVPSGTHKPYATNSGTYKIREDGRNNPLHPEPLLKMFLEREGDEFRKRFAEATSRLDESMNGALNTVGRLEHAISSKIDEIGNSLGWAEYKAGDSADTIEVVERNVALLLRETQDLTQRLRAVVRKIDAVDPVKKKAEEAVRLAMMQKLKDSPDFFIDASKGEPLSLSIEGSDAGELDKDDIARLLNEAMKELSPKTRENKNP
jgi:hypothetical protein